MKWAHALQDQSFKQMKTEDGIYEIFFFLEIIGYISFFFLNLFFFSSFLGDLFPPTV